MTKQFWKWPAIIREKEQALESARKAQDELDVGLLDIRNRMDAAHAISAQFQETARNTKADLTEANERHNKLAKMLGEQGLELEAVRTELANSTTDLLRSNLEAEKLKAELEKTKHALDRAALATEAEKAQHEKTRGQLIKTAEWVFKTHRLVIPPVNGIRGMLARVSMVLLLLLPMLGFSALPPPVVGNSWSTNRPPRPVEGQDNLSVTNLGSGTNWQFFNVGPKTVARLTDVTNIATAVGGDAGGTNARQFGTLSLTNLSGNPNVATNILGAGSVTVTSNNLGEWTITGATVGDPGGTNARQFGTLTLTNLSGNPIPYTNIIVADIGIALGTNAGIVSITNTMNTNAFQPAAANLTNWANIPTGAMANVVATDYLTNWANAISNLANTKQFGSANLTNWSNIPTGAMANVVSTDFLTNWANAISNLTTAVTNSASVTNWINFRQPADAVLSNLVGTVAGNVTNVISLSTTNATSKPLTNSYTVGVLTFFGLEQGANITLTPNASNIVVASTASGGGAFNIDQFDASGSLTNIKSGALVTNLSSLNLTNRGDMTNAGLLMVGGAGRFETNVLILGTNDSRYLKLSGGVPSGSILRTDSNTNVVAATIGTGLTFDGTTLSTSFSGLATNANQFAANTTLTIKDTPLLTNINAFGVSTLYTNNIRAERITNQIYFERLDLKTAISFRTNQIDLSLNTWQAFTNTLQTNVVLQVTNLAVGGTCILDIYGAGILGGTVTNAWQVLFTTAGSGTNIFWPVGATNGNYDILVNSNQVVMVRMRASRSTNIIASYKAFE